jgi:hypothetical protein
VVVSSENAKRLIANIKKNERTHRFICYFDADNNWRGPICTRQVSLTHNLGDEIQINHPREGTYFTGGSKLFTSSSDTLTHLTCDTCGCDELAGSGPSRKRTQQIVDAFDIRALFKVIYLTVSRLR